MRSYYNGRISDFLEAEPQSILGTLTSRHEFSLQEQQRNAWSKQIEILRTELQRCDGYICLEYSIPRMGKRVDCVVLIKSVVFVIEFKVGADEYLGHAIDQVLDYALDLKNFHEQSHERTIVPILICTNAPAIEAVFSRYEDRIAIPLKSNGRGLAKIFSDAVEKVGETEEIDFEHWERSAYKPTPTIVEAAQALYRKHRVEELSRSDSGHENLSVTADAIYKVVRDSKSKGLKSICFITGVPGAGKTLAGLNIANSWHDPSNDDHAVFLSGNGPLVDVLREALTRDKINHLEQNNQPAKSKSEVRRETESFIQNVHHFRDDYLRSTAAPTEHVVIFDEAQRAWSMEQTASFMKRKKGRENWNQSEPEFLISVMDRHSDWAVIVCLIGGGQEINTGESGIQEWIRSIKNTFSHWQVHVSNRLVDNEYTNGMHLFNEPTNLKVAYSHELHLSVCIRSFRSEKVSAFVKAVLDCEQSIAQSLLHDVMKSYPIVLTRDFSKAKAWLQSKARGSERFGVLASSGAMRLKAIGVNVAAPVDPVFWFLNPKDDVRSSYYMEDVATEFDVQGLELDWSCIVWDADLRFQKNEFIFRSFRGSKWQSVNKPEAMMFLKNAYRVLLTRARQGMVIVVPEGSTSDHTRKHEYYDPTYHYLKSIGLALI